MTRSDDTHANAFASTGTSPPSLSGNENGLALERSPWVNMRGLADYSGWGFNTVKRLSSRNLIPGKVRHEGKVRFHLPTFDEWLLSEHREGPLVALPHEERSIRSNGRKPRGTAPPSLRKASSDAS